MISKNIIFTKVNTSELVGEPVADPAPHQIVVKLACSTVSSGTERANITGSPNVTINSRDTVAHFPRRSGYSSSGTVYKTGSAVTDLKPGDRVALFWSTHSQYCVIDAANAVKLPTKCRFPTARLCI